MRRTKLIHFRMIKINKDIDMDKLGMHICYNITNYLHTLPMFNKYKTFKVDVYTMGGEIVIAIYQTTSIMFYINAIWNIPSHGFSHFNDLDVNEMYKLCNDVINACYVFPLLVHVNQKTFAAEFKNMVQSLNK